MTERTARGPSGEPHRNSRRVDGCADARRCGWDGTEEELEREGRSLHARGQRAIGAWHVIAWSIAIAGFVIAGVAALALGLGIADMLAALEGLLLRG